VAQIVLHSPRMMLRCPFCGSDGYTFLGLKFHIYKVHMSAKCVVCGEEFRHLYAHVYHKAILEMRGEAYRPHAILWALMPNHHSRRRDREFLKTCVKYTIRACAAP